MRHANRALFVMMFAALAGPAWRRRRAGAIGRSASGLPVPRFVSLKADKVNMHIGPAKTYEVKWVYQRAGLPVEITAEFENWRRIRDADGTEGWVYHSLLSGRRTGMVIAKTKDELVAGPREARRGQRGDRQARARRASARSSAAPARAGAVFHGQGFDGWIQQVRLWGVYPNEKVD